MLDAAACCYGISSLLASCAAASVLRVASCEKQAALLPSLLSLLLPSSFFIREYSQIYGNVIDTVCIRNEIASALSLSLVAESCVIIIIIIHHYSILLPVLQFGCGIVCNDDRIINQALPRRWDLSN